MIVPFGATISFLRLPSSVRRGDARGMTTSFWVLVGYQYSYACMQKKYTLSGDHGCWRVSRSFNQRYMHTE